MVGDDHHCGIITGDAYQLAQLLIQVLVVVKESSLEGIVRLKLAMLGVAVFPKAVLEAIRTHIDTAVGT